jgi:uncharacterized protein (TIGR02118 family)
MQFTFVKFNYASNDLEAEERNYLEHHVALAKSLPGLRLYYTGKLSEHRGQKPDHFRAAILAFDNAAVAGKAFQAPAGPALIADTQAHLRDLRSLSFEGEVIVPFDARKAGQRCFVMAAEFNLEKSGGLEAAEKRYREHHVGIARRLPGLRNYMIGKLQGDAADRYRIAVLAFDSIDAFKNAYRSAVGLELVKDETETIRDARVHRIDARVEV